MGSDTLSLIIILFCIIMSAYFSATETAFSSLNRIRVKNMAEKGDRKAALVLSIADNYDSMLSTILIGNNIVNIASASLATVLFVKMLGEDAGASMSTIVTTVVVLIFGEVSPKSIAKESPEAFARFSAPFLKVLIKVLTPLNFLFRQWKKLLSCIIKTKEERGITEEELLTIVEEAEAVGGIGKEEGTLIRSAIEFNELAAVDIFTPRVDVVGVSVNATKDEVAEIFAQTGYSRLPVYENNMDEILGILYQKDFHNSILRTDTLIREAVRPVLFVAKNKKIGDLMKELQQKKLHIAIVMDEYGGTAGIVTLEDILEELVGEIWDEHDEVVSEMEQLGENEYRVSGKANVEKIFERLHMEKDFDVLTVSGWVMEQLGCIPTEGDSFESDGLKVIVTKMWGKRIGEVRILVDLS
ncbi:MAG: HlyC/CorC family transporter [Roseburia sp.]